MTDGVADYLTKEKVGQDDRVEENLMAEVDEKVVENVAK